MCVCVFFLFVFIFGSDLAQDLLLALYSEIRVRFRGLDMMPMIKTHFLSVSCHPAPEISIVSALSSRPGTVLS